jgi:hypothetical protein
MWHDPIGWRVVGSHEVQPHETWMRGGYQTLLCLLCMQQRGRGMQHAMHGGTMQAVSFFLDTNRTQGNGRAALAWEKKTAAMDHEAPREGCWLRVGALGRRNPGCSAGLGGARGGLEYSAGQGGGRLAGSKQFAMASAVSSKGEMRGDGHGGTARTRARGGEIETTTTHRLCSEKQ